MTRRGEKEKYHAPHLTIKVGSAGGGHVKIKINDFDFTGKILKIFRDTGKILVKLDGEFGGAMVIDTTKVDDYAEVR